LGEEKTGFERMKCTSTKFAKLLIAQLVPKNREETRLPYRIQIPKEAQSSGMGKNGKLLPSLL
jgi:hypothetical protein